MIVHCATGNKGKLREFHLAGELLGIDVEALPDLKSIAAPEETGATFEDNAKLKAEYYSRYAPGLLFADDSGLEVDALGGAPGVYSARYAGEGAGDEANNQLLLKNLEGRTDRSGRFVCVIAIARAGETLATFRGEVEGEILHAPKGSGGFGYDPLFWYKEFGCSLAEVPEEKKFAVSHRGKALRMMLAWLKEMGK